MSIVEFLNARIAEDEAAALAASVPGAGYEPHPIPGAVLLARNMAARMLAECAAKRAIVEQAAEVELMEEVHLYERGVGGPGEVVAIAPAILGALASVYADHEDYQQGWGV